MTPTQTRNPARNPIPARSGSRPGAGTSTGRTRPSGPTPVRPPSRRFEPKGVFRLTGRGAIVALFLLCFLSLLTGWSVLADVAFVCGCGVVTYYTKFGGLRNVVVCPPLVFLAGCICAKAMTSSGRFAMAEGILVTLGTSAPWLFTGTGLTIAIALGRGFRPVIPLLAKRAR
jgi:hypothetical protein